MVRSTVGCSRTHLDIYPNESMLNWIKIRIKSKLNRMVKFVNTQIQFEYQEVSYFAITPQQILTRWGNQWNQSLPVTCAGVPSSSSLPHSQASLRILQRDQSFNGLSLASLHLLSESEKRGVLEPESRSRSDDLLDHERKLMGHAWVMRLQSCNSLVMESKITKYTGLGVHRQACAA